MCMHLHTYEYVPSHLYTLHIYIYIYQGCAGLDTLWTKDVAGWVLPMQTQHRWFSLEACIFVGLWVGGLAVLYFIVPGPSTQVKRIMIMCVCASRLG
jgi:hypothetical protein